MATMLNKPRIYGYPYGGFARRQLLLDDASLDSAASEVYGSYGGHGYHKDCDNGISIALLLTAVLGLAVGFFTLFTKITMAMGGRRRRGITLGEKAEGWGALIENLQDVIYGGTIKKQS